MALTLAATCVMGLAACGEEKLDKDHQLVSWNGQVDVLQIILSRTLDANGVVHGIHLGFQILSYSILYHNPKNYATYIFKQIF